MAKPKCPACGQDVATPFFLNTDAWRWLKCAHCAARLERKNPRFAAAAGSLMLVLIALGGRGPRAAIVSEVLMGALVVVVLVEFMRPRLQVRKALPEPEIKLNTDGPSS